MSEREACLRYVSRAIEQANARKRAWPALLALEAMLKLGTGCEDIALGPEESE